MFAVHSVQVQTFKVENLLFATFNSTFNILCHLVLG